MNPIKLISIRKKRDSIINNPMYDMSCRRRIRKSLELEAVKHSAEIEFQNGLNKKSKSQKSVRKAVRVLFESWNDIKKKV